MSAAHRFIEPRWCSLCAETVETGSKYCPHCDGPTIALDARDEAAWEREQEDWLSEPPVTVAEQHQAAWHLRQALRGGR